MFPTGKEKKKSKKRSLDRAWVWCGLVLFSVYPLISQMSLPLSAARGACLPFAWVPALGTGTGAEEGMEGRDLGAPL